jgi:ABC-type dipeptide/oligopeptide/nickel transport system permease component
LVYVARRLLAAIPVLIGVTIAVFLLVHLIPGDPAAMIAGPDAPPEEVERIREELGLNRPLPVRYLHYVEGLLRGDLGRSLLTHRPIAGELRARFPATLELATASVFLSVVVGVPIGVGSAVRRYSFLDHASMTVALVGLSMPIFWVGIMLILIFALRLGILPVSGRGGPVWTLGGLRHLILPTVTLAGASLAMIARLTRSAMLEVLRQEYVMVARSKGLSERVVIYKHALRNALIPVVTYVGLEFGALLGGAVVTESIFAWPGVGRFLLSSIEGRDYPAIQGSVLMLATVFVFVNIAVDLMYGFLDPRLRVR